MGDSVETSIVRAWLGRAPGVTSLAVTAGQGCLPAGMRGSRWSLDENHGAGTYPPGTTEGLDMGESRGLGNPKDPLRTGQWPQSGLQHLGPLGH